MDFSFMYSEFVIMSASLEKDSVLCQTSKNNQNVLNYCFIRHMKATLSIAKQEHFMAVRKYYSI